MPGMGGRGISGQKQDLGRKPQVYKRLFLLQPLFLMTLIFWAGSATLPYIMMLHGPNVNLKEIPQHVESRELPRKFSLAECLRWPSFQGHLCIPASHLSSYIQAECTEAIAPAQQGVCQKTLHTHGAERKPSLWTMGTAPLYVISLDPPKYPGQRVLSYCCWSRIEIHKAKKVNNI